MVCNMKKCPICDSKKYLRITERYGVSPFSNKLFSEKKLAIDVPKCNLLINLCLDCGFIYNEAFDNSIDLYDKDYNNSQNASKLFDNYVNDSVEYLFNNYMDNNTSKIVEIGCGRNATYLSKCYEQSKLSNRNIKFIGYDPSCVCLNDNENFIVYPKYYDLSVCERLDADIIISRHVIEHIDKPLKLLQSLSCLNENNSKAISYVETPDATWILKNNVFYDFPYEHCSLFTPISLKNAMSQLGLSLKELKLTFGEQYMCAYFGQDRSGYVYSESIEELVDEASKYKKNEGNVISFIDSFIDSYEKRGKIALWGAGAKGNVILNLLDKDEKRIDSVIDVNKDKWGKYISGTGHEIISPEDIVNHNIDTIFVMNRNYYDEIIKLVENLEYKVKCVNLDMELNKNI